MYRSPYSRLDRNLVVDSPNFILILISHHETPFNSMHLLRFSLHVILNHSSINPKHTQDWAGSPVRRGFCPPTWLWHFRRLVERHGHAWQHLPRELFKHGPEPILRSCPACIVSRIYQSCFSVSLHRNNPEREKENIRLGSSRMRWSWRIELERLFLSVVDRSRYRDLINFLGACSEPRREIYPSEINSPF